MKKNTTVLTLIFMWVSCLVFAQTPVIRTDKKVVEGFMDKRFGMFIHWGPVSLRGTEIGWSRTTSVATEEYDNLYKEFNPVLFDADKWAKTAKDAGMKYLTITSKHHDGFCLWPTVYSDYNIMNSPYKKDIVGELAKACKKYDLKFCIYFTVADWHDPDWAVLYPATTPNKSANMGRFVSRMKNELKELIQNYKPYMLWFDANWDKEWTREYSSDVYNEIKKLDPNVIINNRLDTKDASGGSHKVMLPGTLADFATPEQEVGEYGLSLGKLYYHLSAMGMETKRQNEIFKGMYPDLGKYGGWEWKSIVQCGPDDGWKDRSKTGKPLKRNGQLVK
jgi:alpha-L-fucosidase